MRRFALFLATIGAISVVLAPTSASASSIAAKNAAYVAKGKAVALAYWSFRKPGASCADRPIDVSIVSSQLTYGQWAYVYPIGACQQPYDPSNDLQPFIKLSTAPRNAGWRAFCTSVIQGWGYLTGELASKNPKDVMYPRITSRNYQHRACGRAPRY